MNKLVWLWVREDGERPCLIQRGKPPRGKGEVFQVEGARNRSEAASAVALALGACPDEEKDPHGFLAWRAARRVVKRVVYDAERGVRLEGVTHG